MMRFVIVCSALCVAGCLPSANLTVSGVNGDIEYTVGPDGWSKIENEPPYLFQIDEPDSNIVVDIWSPVMKHSRVFDRPEFGTQDVVIVRLYNDGPERHPEGQMKVAVSYTRPDNNTVGAITGEGLTAEMVEVTDSEVVFDIDTSNDVFTVKGQMRFPQPSPDDREAFVQEPIP